MVDDNQALPCNRRACNTASELTQGSISSALPRQDGDSRGLSGNENYAGRHIMERYTYRDALRQPSPTESGVHIGKQSRTVRALTIDDTARRMADNYPMIPPKGLQKVLRPESLPSVNSKLQFSLGVVSDASEKCIKNLVTSRNFVSVAVWLKRNKD